MHRHCTLKREQELLEKIAGLEKELEFAQQRNKDMQGQIDRQEKIIESLTRKMAG